MTAAAGSTTFKYEAIVDWARLPEGVTLKETPGVAVDGDGYVYALTRNTSYPLIVFDRDGTYLRSFGAGVFSERTHGVTVGPDGFLYCTDDGNHTVTKWSREGELLMTIGSPNQPAPRFSGRPFNRPTQADVSRHTGHIFISDGYGNSRVHKYTADGQHVLSWGEPGIDAGQFIRPHNIAVDGEDRVYVADRECHRIQVFDADGAFLTMWNNIHRPCGITIGPDNNLYIGELNGMAGVDDAPGLGHRISVYDLSGTLLARYGAPEEGEGPGQFIAPHGIGVDRDGNVYVGEVSYTIRGSRMQPPRELRSLTKLVRQPAG
jgi:DNA-binding beta-propeller fold protein YncE